VQCRRKKKYTSFWFCYNDNFTFDEVLFFIPGMRAIGAGIGLSIVSALFINGALAPKTSPVHFSSYIFICTIGID
jgi:hypothetical protein